MAIIAEEERARVNVTRVLMWFTILVIMGTSVYYIFFARPQIIDIAAPAAFQNIEPLAKIDLSPDSVVDQVDRQLRIHVTPPAPGNAGRANPFVAP